MKVVICLLVAAVAAVSARPQNPFATITKYNFNPLELGGYVFSYESSDGSRREETGKVINQGTDDEAVVVEGSYSYKGDDGKEYNVKYIADENGFQPEGEHIPPAADVNKPSLGIPPSALASLAGK